MNEKDYGTCRYLKVGDKVVSDGYFDFHISIFHDFIDL